MEMQPLGVYSDPPALANTHDSNYSDFHVNDGGSAEQNDAEAKSGYLTLANPDVVVTPANDVVRVRRFSVDPGVNGSPLSAHRNSTPSPISTHRNTSVGSRRQITLREIMDQQAPVEEA